jgi:3-phosphoshikimate 1-carboxyvinyltransferase/cytidylate kinase
MSVPQNAPVIAIDGPSASGKGSVAARVAAELDFHYLDSGALYRLVGLAALNAKIALEPDQEQALADIALHLNTEFRGNQVYLDGKPVTDAIRTEACGKAASQVAALPGVRSALLDRQRGFCRPPGLVADGRDMGTVVFQAAELKIFLTASPQTRAERRYKQLIENGIDANISLILQDIGERDARDSARSVAPLQVAEDAQVIDSTGLDIAQVVAQVLNYWRHRTPK